MKEYATYLLAFTIAARLVDKRDELTPEDAGYYAETARKGFLIGVSPFEAGEIAATALTTVRMMEEQQAVQE